MQLLLVVPRHVREEHMKPQERTAAILRSGLPCELRMIAIVIADHMDEDGAGSFPSVPTIARMSGLCERTVQAWVKRARSDGWLTRDEKPGMQRQPWYIDWSRLPPQQDLHPRRTCTPAEPAPVQEMHHTPAEPAPDPRKTCGRSAHDPPTDPPRQDPVVPMNLDADSGASCPPPAASHPKWAVQLLLALHGVGCRIDDTLPAWVVGKVPESEAQKICDWLQDAKARGKKYKSPRAFLNNWISKSTTDRHHEQPNRQTPATPKPPAGHFPGGRDLDGEDRDRARRAAERLRAAGVSVPGPV